MGMETQQSDNTFDINLAPVLDIIVSVVPMLLLSVAFLQVKMIETPVPQVVAEASERAQKEAPIEVSLEASKKSGFSFLVKDKGKTKTVKVALQSGNLNFDELYVAAAQIKREYPQVFELSLNPTGDMPLDDLVKAMDSVRRFKPQDGKVSFNDPATGQKVETDFLFPNVMFANVVGE